MTKEQLTQILNGYGCSIVEDSGGDLDKSLFGFVHISDLHLYPLNRKPPYRKDNYYEQIKSEYNIIGSIAHKLNAACVSISGDILHFRGQRVWTTEDFQFLKNIFNWDTQIVISPGNHDLTRGSCDEYPESPIYYFSNISKNITDLYKTPKTYEVGKYKFYFDCLPFVPDFDENNIYVQKLKQRLKENKQENTEIILSLHQEIVPAVENIGYLQGCILYDKMVELFPEPDVFVLGHIHTRFSTQYCQGKLVSNPESIEKVCRPRGADLVKGSSLVFIYFTESDGKLEKHFITIDLPKLDFEENFIQLTLLEQQTEQNFGIVNKYLDFENSDGERDTVSTLESYIIDNVTVEERQNMLNLLTEIKKELGETSDE